ncbi:MAG: hypothetical protein IPK74_04550 [Deltaproteobacteria bacterium]|nr:hypothetical protein [Deltaproteobacteria bacterium]
MLVLAACGPAVVEPVDLDLWLTGIWSGDFMDEDKMQASSSQGVGEGAWRGPTHYSFDEDGVLLESSQVRGLAYEVRDTFSWISIGDDELSIANSDGKHYRLRVVEGERGCDALDLLTNESGILVGTFYRGAICSKQNVECTDPDPLPTDPCTYYHYVWCDDQGDNVAVPNQLGRCDEDCYCHLPGER